MKFELSDEAVLRLSSAASATFAANFGLFPKQAHDTFFAAGTAYSGVSNRYIGMALGGVSATTLAVSASDSSREAKKGALKAVGAMWLTAAGMDAFYTYNGMAKKETNIATTAANTALGVLCLWRGFKKDSGGSSLAK